MKLSNKWIVFGLITVAVLAWPAYKAAQVWQVYRYVTTAKRFDVAANTIEGKVHIRIDERHELVIPREYLMGVTTNHDGSIYSVGLIHMKLPEIIRHPLAGIQGSVPGRGDRIEWHMTVENPSRNYLPWDSSFVETKLGKFYDWAEPDGDTPPGVKRLKGRPDYLGRFDELFFYPSGLAIKCESAKLGPQDYHSPGCEGNFKAVDNVTQAHYSYGRNYINQAEQIEAKLKQIVDTWIVNH